MDARFCDGCGAPVDDAAASGSPSDESAARKTVTALFCDLAGSTAFGERVDEESVRDAMARYRHMAQSAIETNGGEVAKFIGDGVMALWGVGEVAADDAVRAVQAAGALQEGFAAIEAHVRDRHGVDVGLRVGVNTGEVVIAANDDDVVGDALNTAARLEAAAVPGRVLVGQSTWRLTRHDVEYREPVEVAAKGKDEPVVAYEAVFDTTVVESATPFVGRAAELAVLRQVLDDAILQREARMVTVVGSPGVGKTRLAQELRTDVEGGVRSFDLRCEPSGDATFAPIADLLREVADLRDGQSTTDIVAALRVVVGDTEDPDRTAELLAGFLGAAPMRSTEEVFTAVRRLFEVLGASEPVVLVVDDIQWAEPLFLDLLEHLAEWVRTVPLMVVALARPEIREVRSSFAELGRRISAVVVLEGLDRATTGELAARLLDADELPDGLLDRIPESTDGNPLFVREVVRMLVDDGIISNETGRWELLVDLEAVEVPPTVTALLASRVDRMAPDERRILELASVVGSEFPVGALAEIHDLPRADLDGALERMRRKELVEPTGAYLGDEPVLRFHHVLIREAAYRRLLKGTRAELHQAVGEWTERVSASLVGEFEVAIATHLEQAHTYRRELDRDDDATAALGRRAAGLFEIAATRALEREDLEAAGSLASRALAVIPDTAPEVPELLLVACEALLSIGRVTEAQPLIDRLASVGDGDPRLMAWHACFSAELAVLTDPSGVARAETQVAAAAQTLTELEDTAGVAKARWVRALALVRLGQVGECESELDLALTAARTADDRRRVTAVLGAAPMAALWGPSPVPRAGGRCLDVIRLLRITTASPSVEATSVRCQGLLEAMRGRFDTARSMLGDARGTVEELGLSHGVAQVELYLGIAELLAHDPAAAEPHLRAAYRGLGTLGIGPDAGQAAGYLARALLLQGRLDDAEELVEEADALAGENQQTAIVVRAVHAEVLAARGRHDEALVRADEAVALAAERDILFDHANAVAAQARVRAAAGDPEGAARAAADAAALYEQKGAVVDVETAGGDGHRASSLPGVDRPRSDGSRVRDTDTRAGGSRRELWSRAERDALELVRLAAGADDHGDEVRSRVADDAVAEDRRLDRERRAEGRGDVVDLVRALAELSPPDPTVETIAVRGDDLVLLRLAPSRAGVGAANDRLVLVRVTPDGSLGRCCVFDADQLDDALDTLDHLHMATLPVREQLHFEESVVRPRLIERDSADAFRYLHPTEFRMIDRRSLGFPELGATEYLDRVRMLHDLGARMTLIARRVERAAPRATLAEYRTVITSAEGDDSHQDSLILSLAGPSGLCVRQMQFDLEDEAAAIAVADEHLRAHRLSPTNLAVIVGAHVHARVLPLHPSMASAPGRIDDEDRLTDRVVDPSRLDREPHAFDIMDRRVLAVRGDELALVEARREGGEVVWSLEEVDTDGRLVDWELFDDLRAATDRLEARFVEIDPANRDPALEFIDAFRALDPDRTRACVTDDFVVVDRKRLGLGALTLDEWIGIFDAVRSAYAVPVVQDRLARSGEVTIRRSIAVSSSAPDEMYVFGVAVTRGDRLARLEMFDLDDEEAAWARYRELAEPDSPSTDEFWSRADRLAHETAAILFSSDDRSDEWATHASDVVEPLDHDLDALAARSWQNASTQTVAVRGDDLALFRVSAEPVDGSDQRDVLMLARFATDDRLLSIRLYEPTAIVDAVRDLDRRHMDTLPVAERLLFDNACAGTTRVGDGDTAASFRMLHPDEYGMEDRRALGFPTLDLDGWLERVGMLRELSGDWLLLVRRVLLLEPRAQLTQCRALVHPGQSDESYQDSLILTMVGDEGLAVGMIQFEVDDIAEARRTADDWLTQHRRPSYNLAAVVGAEVNARLLPFHPAMSSPEEIAGDRRRLEARVVDVDRLAREPHAFGIVDRRVLATRGDELALIGARRENEDVVWSVEEVDADGRLVDWRVFDQDQLREAYSDVSERYDAYRSVARSGGTRYSDPAGFLSNVDDDFELVDHRRVGYGVLDRHGFVDAFRRGAEQETVLIEAETWAVANDVILTWSVLVRPDLTTPDPGRLQITLWHPGRMSRVEIFDVDDEDAAWARYRELADAEQHPIRNLATEVGERLHDRVGRGAPPEEIEALLGDGVDLTAEPHGFGVTSRRPIAVRGEELALFEVEASGERGWSLEEVDRDGTLIDWELFDADALTVALQRLDERVRDLHPEVGDIGGGPFIRAVQTLDPVGFEASVTDDFETVDHRRLGFGRISRDMFATMVRDGSMDVPIVAEHLANTETVAFTRNTSAYPEDGMESPYLSVSTWNDRGVRRIELFDIEDEDTAWTCYRELTEPGTVAGDDRPTESEPGTNLATEAWRPLTEAWERGDVEEAMRHIRADMTFEVRRHGVRGMSGGLDALIENVSSWSEVGLRPTFTTLGVFGDRHAIRAVTLETPDAAETVPLLAVIACDEDGRISSIELFDDVDLRAAIAAAAGRYLDEVDGHPPVARAWYGLLAVREPWSVFADDTVLHDHRTGSLMALTGHDFRHLQKATEVDNPGIATLSEPIDVAERVGLFRTRRWADPGVGVAEWDVYSVVVAEPGHVDRLEVFSLDQRAEAGARFEELCAEHEARSSSTAIVNLAVTGQIDHARLSREGRWTELRSGFHPDFAMESHRHLGATGTSDVDALIDDVRSFGEMGFVVLDPTPLRVVGDLHALLQNRSTTPDGQELEMLRVVEVDADGRCRRSANFEVDDRASAEALLDQWVRDSGATGREVSDTS